MKLIFFSDLHKDISILEKLLQKEDGIFYSLGDSELDKQTLNKYNIISVKGNCDSAKLNQEIILDLDDKKVLLCHGHDYNVKYKIENLYYYTKSINCNVVIFGHTHNITRIEEDILILNPGSLKDGQTYIVYENGEFIFKRL